MNVPDPRVTSAPLDSVKLIPPSVLCILYDQLALLHRVCVAHGIKYWLIGGSLLGQVRGDLLQKRFHESPGITKTSPTKYYPGIILWDDDIDVGINVDDKEKLRDVLSPEAAKYGYVVWNSTHGLKLKYRDKEGIGTDIFIYERVYTGPEKPLHTSLNDYTGYAWVLASPSSRAAWPRDYFLDEEIAVVQLAPFGALSVYIPTNATRYLYQLYGADCMEVGKLDFNHLENKKHEHAGVKFSL